MTVFEHTVPVGLLVVAVAVAVLAGAWSAWRFLPRNTGNMVLGGLYLAVVAGLAWCLLLPGRKDAVTQLLKPRFIIALDTSRSMLQKASDEIPDRWEMANRALQQPWTRILAADCEVEVFPFSTKVVEGISLGEAGGLEAEGGATLLRDSLRQIADRFSGVNVAGALLLSDGIDTREAFDDWAGDDRPFPIHTVRLEPAGEWLKEPDLRIDAVTTARRVTVGWKTEFKVRVSGQGTRGAPVAVQVFENGKLREEMPAQIADEGGEKELVFEFDHPDVGIFNYRVYVPPLPGEENTQDNEYALSVIVVDARNRVLYVEGPPRWEYKFLRRVLLSHQQITPVIFYTGADGKPKGGVQVGDMRADMTPDQLAFYNIVIIGNIDAKELTEERARNLEKFVNEGGSLVVLGGRKAWEADGILRTSVGKILPVKSAGMSALQAKEAFPVRLTDTARGHPAFAGDAELWEIIPPVLSVFSGGVLSPAAEALVTAETPQGPQPIVVTQRYGQGKVTAILTDSLWRWQLGPEASTKKPYQRFWTQLITWLLPQQEDLDEDKLDLFADRDQLFLGEEIDIHARIGGDKPPGDSRMDCRITLPDGREVPYKMTPRQVTTPSGSTFPGFALPFKAEVPGLYKAIASAEVAGVPRTSDPFSFFVRPYSPETMPRPVNVNVLKAIATASGGRFHEDLESLDQALSSLELNAIEDSSAQFHSLWRNWLLVVALMLVLAVTWALRKFRNMP